MYNPVGLLFMLGICLSAYVHCHEAQFIGNGTKTPSNYRLPTDVLPINYNLSITPYLDKHSPRYLTFDGVVDIQMEVKQSVRKIIMHARYLNFGKENCTLKKTNGEDINNFSVTFETQPNFVIFSMLDDETFSEGKYILKINYLGGISDYSNEGFFIKSYLNGEKEDITYAATFFEPIYARHVFPCFDEPNYKATYDLTIVHSKNYKALSNMPVKSTSYANSTATTTFKTSPPMSTYLFAFFLSDFQNISNSFNNFTVHAPSYLLQYGHLGLELEEEVFKELEKFTDIKYQLGKMDQIGSPLILKRAMGNWGLITYGGNAFFHFGFNGYLEKLNKSIYIAHELTHQWFGNVATPKWWNDLWLSESITTFISHYILQKIQPTSRAMDKFFIFDIQSALITDSDPSTLPIVMNEKSPSGIVNLFINNIIYTKGAAIIRMIQHTLTESVFQKALRNYLIKTYNKNADSDDFFKAVQEVVDSENIKLDVKNFMNAWININGYPIVNVIRNYTAQTIEFKQEHFLTSNVTNGEQENPHIWHIPITYASTGKLDFDKTTADYWLTNTSMTVQANIDCKRWIIVNKQQAGFYRVNYDTGNWERIMDYLSSHEREKIHVLNRAQLMFDAFTFVQQGKLDFKILLRLTGHLKNETKCLAWYPAFPVLQWFKEKLGQSVHYPYYKDYVLKLMINLIDTIGFDENKEDDDFTKFCRVKVIELACDIGSPACHNNSYEKLIKMIADPKKNAISPDLMFNTLCFGLRAAYHTGKESTIDSTKIGDSIGLNTRVTSLGCIADEKNLKKELNKYLDSDMGSYQVYPIIRTALDKNSTGVDMILDFLIDNFSKVQRFKYYLTNVIEKVATKVTTTAQQEKLKTSEYMKMFPKEIAKGFKATEENVEWLKKNENISFAIIAKI